MYHYWRYFSVITMFCAGISAQIPAQEDLETKARRESFQDGLEIREVRESSAKDVGEALEDIEGVWKLRKGGIANDVVLRGFQGNNLNILIDGVRIYGACPGHMDPAAFHVDFAEVERVEMTKGSFDLSNQGSLGGSVNIIRKRSSPGIHFTPSLQTGSFGYMNPAMVGAVGNDALELSGGYSFRRSAPFRDGLGNRMTTVGGYRPQYWADDAFRINTGWAGLRFSPARNQSGEFAYTRQDGANILYPYLQMDSPYDIADRLNARYDIRRLAGPLERLQLNSYYTRVRHWMTDEKRITSQTALAAFGMATFARTRVSGGRADLTFRGGLTAGVEGFQRNWDAVNSFRTPQMFTDQNIIPNVNSTIAGAYVEYGKSLSDRLRVGGGLRIDTAHMYTRSQAMNVNLFEAYKGAAPSPVRDTNPSGNARVGYGLTGDLELFAGAGATVRIPDAQERFYQHRRMGSDWVGNPTLRPSRNTEANLGLNLRRRNFYVKPLVFYSRLGDFVVVHNQARVAARPGVMNTMARSYANVDARIYGGEITSGFTINSRMLISAGLSYSRGSKDALPTLGIHSTNLPEMPPLKGRISIRYGTRRWFGEAEGIAANSQERIDLDLREAPTGGYGIANLKFGVHVRQITVTAGVDNVFNRFYLAHLSFQRDPFRNGQRVPEPGRNLFLNIGYAF